MAASWCLSLLCLSVVGTVGADTVVVNAHGDIVDHVSSDTLVRRVNPGSLANRKAHVDTHGASGKEAPTFWLSPTGDDATGKPGKKSKPYGTLAGLLAANDLSQTGATIYFRTGVYRWSESEGTVNGLVSPGVVLEPDPKDKMKKKGNKVIFSGTKKLKWSKEGDWYCAPVPKAETDLQVWHDGRSMIEAQAPDITGFLEDSFSVPEDPTQEAKPTTGHLWHLGGSNGNGMLKAPTQPDPAERMAVPPHCYFGCPGACPTFPGTGGEGCPLLQQEDACAAQHGTLTDPRFSKGNYVGGSLLITLCSHKQTKGPFPIIKHDPLTSTVTFDYSSFACDPNQPNKKTDMFKGMITCWNNADWAMPAEPRFIVRGAAELDQPREWAVDEDQICTILDEDDSPTKLEVRTRGRALTIIGSENIVVRDMEFRYTEFSNSAVNGVGRNVVFDGMRSSWARVLNLGPATLQNSEVRYAGRPGGGGVDSSMSGISFNGYLKKKDGEDNFEGCTLKNTLIERSWSAVDFWDCQPATAAGNTVRWIYNGNVFQIFNLKAPVATVSNEVKFNRIHDVGYAPHCDCAMVQTRWGAMKEMKVHNNWIYNSGPLKAVRFDTSNNGGAIYQNVYWNTRKGLMVKGGMDEGNYVFYNTGFGNKDCDMSVVPKEFGDGSTTPGKIYNDQSMVYNNAADDWRDYGKANCETSDACTLPCQSGSNAKHWGGTKIFCAENPPVTEMLADVANYFFRPADEHLIDQADQTTVGAGYGGADIGAYDAAGGTYWMPGRVGNAPSDPVPPHGSPYGRQLPTLAWLSSTQGPQDVFASTSFCAVLVATPSSPAHVGTVDGNALHLPNQNIGDVIYWRVGEGSVWCFHVTDETLSKPWNMMTGKHACSKKELTKKNFNCCSKANKSNNPVTREKKIAKCEQKAR